jgi:uncharacterized OB-fold protein
MTQKCPYCGKYYFLTDGGKCPHCGDKNDRDDNDMPDFLKNIFDGFATT